MEGGGTQVVGSADSSSPRLHISLHCSASVWAAELDQIFTRQIKDGLVAISENNSGIVCVKRLIILCLSHIRGLSQNVTLLHGQTPGSTWNMLFCEKPKEHPVSKQT